MQNPFRHRERDKEDFTLSPPQELSLQANEERRYSNGLVVLEQYSMPQKLLPTY